jgi:hypothetical protein
MPTLVQAILAVTAVGVIVTLLAAFLRERAQYKAIRTRYAPVVDVDEEVAKSRTELEKVRADLERAGTEYLKQKTILGQEYAAAKAIYDRLKGEIALLEEHLEDISFGLYKPHYDFDTSEKYRAALDDLRSRERDLIRNGSAATIGVAWTINNSRREGERMQKQYVKLMLRAFNGECDAAVAKVTWNNIVKMEERIRKGFEAINTLGGVMQISINRLYLDLKIAELRLEFEGEEKKRQEIEEQRRIKEQMREEERALREAERAKEEAEAEEARYQKALERARAEMANAQGAALEELNKRIGHLDAALQKARDMKDKATMMAQLTRAGHIYVISNIGSFGENVFKIGMTRRLEPFDRIKELGDASVPFDFDVHAMIYSEDAPTLECAFHDGFAERRINLINPRKEFFSVSIDEIEHFAVGKSLKLELTKLAEARDYRQTLALRAHAALTKQPPFEVTFPDTLLPTDVRTGRSDRADIAT